MKEKELDMSAVLKSNKNPYMVTSVSLSEFLRTNRECIRNKDDLMRVYRRYQNSTKITENKPSKD